MTCPTLNPGLKVLKDLKAGVERGCTWNFKL